LLYPK